MKYKLIKDLVDRVEEFHKENKSDSLDDFRYWLNEQAYKKDSPTKLFSQEKKQVYDLENEISKQIILLSRFSKQMIRKGLTLFPELMNEEFTYLYRLMSYPSLTKMELVSKNGHEKQTGIMIIKRLVSSSLIEEFSDEQDKRITRLKITDKGKQMFTNSVQDVTTTAKVLSAKLSKTEKNQLLALLKKLNDFHFMVYNHHKKSSIEEISELV